MKLEKGRIGLKGTVLIMIGYIYGSTAILSPGVGVGQDAWVAQTIGLGLALIVVWVNTLLLARFPGQTFIEINERVFGPYAGKFISLLFLWYIFHLGSIVLIDHLDFVRLMIIPLTPAEVVVFLGILPCIYAAYKGLEVIVRTGQVLVVFTLLYFGLITLFQVQSYDFANFKPFLVTPFPKLAWAGLTAASFPYLETVVFLMILPFLNQQNKVRVAVYLGLFFGGLVVIWSIMRLILVLGDTAVNYVYPSYYAVRIINISELLNRFEILAAMNYIMIGFLKVTVLLYAAGLGWAQLCKCQDYRPLLLPLGALMALVSLNNFEHVVGNFEFTTQVYSIYALPFSAGLPFLVLVGAWVRGLPGKVKNK
jgi:spore germination protein KB